MKKSNDRENQQSFQLKRRVGRPLIGTSRRTKISISVSPAFADAVNRWAYKHDLSRSNALELLATTASFIAIDCMENNK